MAMVFPLASNRSGVPLPSAESLTRAMEIATTAEAMRYLVDGFKTQVMLAGKLDAATTLIAQMQAQAGALDARAAAEGEAWSGRVEQVPSSTAQAFQDALARYAAQNVKIPSVVFNFGVSDKAELVRSYIDERGHVLSAEDTDAMDKMLNAYLVENHTINRGGVIYDIDEKGDIKQDRQGQFSRTKPEALKKALEGFPRYVAQRTQTTNVIVAEQPYPTPESTL